MGSYLSQPLTTKETTSGKGERIEYACTAMQGWRTEMEDSHLTILDVGGKFEKISLFSVFDGHGGREVARFCSQWLPKIAAESGDPNDLEGSMKRLYTRYVILLMRMHYSRLDELLRDPSNQEELKSYKPQSVNPDAPNQNSRALSLLQGSIQTDLQELREKKGQVTRDDATQVMMKMMFLRRLEQQIGSNDQSVEGASVETNIADTTGCTAVSVLVTPTQFVIANAGDSRAVLCRAGRAVALSEDHKPNDDREKERILKAGGTVEESQGGSRTHYRVNGNLNLSRAIGDLEYKKNAALRPDEQIITSTPDVVVMDRTPEDMFLAVCCDGVYDVMTNEDLVAFIIERMEAGKPLTEICEEIADECLSPDPKATQGLGADNITCMIVDLRVKEDDS